jgi:putative oxidoreductase
MSFDRGLLARWAPIPIRLIVGYGFMTHGFLKLGRGVEVFAAALSGLGVPAPDLMAWLTILIEVFGGLAVILGAYVTLASVPMAIVLLVALVKVHLQFGFSSIKFLAVTATGPQFGKPGIECDLLYLACLATLVAAGSGPWSFDTWRKRRS